MPALRMSAPRPASPSRRSRAGVLAAAALAATVVALAGCAGSNPLAPETAGAGDTSAASGKIVVGSAAFAEDEILAYVYADALKAAGFDVDVKPSIGARDAYIAALQDGSIDLVPEYTGNLLQYFDSSATAQSPDDVVAALQQAVPSGFEVLDAAEAQDADSYNVTKAFSEQYGVTSLADLAKVPVPISVGANPELAERPYGIPGLKSIYGVDATLVPINDGGGPNTLAALLDGTVQLADIYSTTPSIAENDLVTLADPEHMILAQNVIPLIASASASDEVVKVLNAIQAKLTTADLIAMNTRSSGDEKASSQRIADDWLAANGFAG